MELIIYSIATIYVAIMVYSGIKVVTMLILDMDSLLTRLGIKEYSFKNVIIITVSVILYVIISPYCLLRDKKIG